MGTRVTRKLAALTVVSGLASCATPPASEPTLLPDASALTGAPVETARKREDLTREVPSLGFAIDERRTRCNADADCQLIASCDCVVCTPSKKMDGQLCPKTCAVDACGGHTARCAGHLCIDVSAVRARPSKKAIDALTAAGQVLLDEPRLQAYFHAAEHPERVPLVVAWPMDTPKPAWNEFGRPVTFAAGLPEKQPYLSPVLVGVVEDNASLAFQYEPEGVFVTAELVKKRGAWQIVHLELRATLHR